MTALLTWLFRKSIPLSIARSVQVVATESAEDGPAPSVPPIARSERSVEYARANAEHPPGDLQSRRSGALFERVEQCALESDAVIARGKRAQRSRQRLRGRETGREGGRMREVCGE